MLLAAVPTRANIYSVVIGNFGSGLVSKEPAPVRARDCAVIVEDSVRPKGGGQHLRTTVFNDLPESRTNKFLFMGRLSW
jgi:hypothetical protein